MKYSIYSFTDGDVTTMHFSAFGKEQIVDLDERLRGYTKLELAFELEMRFGALDINGQLIVPTSYGEISTLNAKEVATQLREGGYTDLIPNACLVHDYAKDGARGAEY